jgi:hypothetical protein
LARCGARRIVRRTHFTQAITMFATLLRVLRAVFVDDVRLRRDAGGLRLDLQPKSPSKPKPKPKDVGLTPAEVKAASKASTELALIQRDLGALFDSVSGSRRALCHLAYVEQELGELGLARLNSMALNPLRQGLAELENAVINWSPAGLASLRSKMAVALRQREAADAGGEADLPTSRMNLPAPDVIESRAGADEADAEQAALLAAYGQAAPVAEKV